MKLTKQQLKQIIKEELSKLREGRGPLSPLGIDPDMDRLRRYGRRSRGTVGPETGSGVTEPVQDPETVINAKLNEAMELFLAVRSEAMEMHKGGDDGGFHIIKEWLGALNDTMQGHAQYQDATQLDKFDIETTELEDEALTKGNQ